MSEPDVKAKVKVKLKAEVKVKVKACQVTKDQERRTKDWGPRTKD